MKLAELDFEFPEELIATEPVAESRVLRSVVGETPREIAKSELLEEFAEGDVLVLNDTRVVKRRVFLDGGIEILFLKDHGDGLWDVLMPIRKLKSDGFVLPGGIRSELVERGRPQKIRVEQPLTEDYFEKNGELPLPPYIQKARGTRKPVEKDSGWYQTAWAKESGSLAAPTASFHFDEADLKLLKSRGVGVQTVTLHVGLGTFLPVVAEDLEDHKMHSEWVSVSNEVWEAVYEAKEQGKRTWALGTTVARSLESCAIGKLEKGEHGFVGATDLFIRPGFDYKVVDRLMTNFHQPKTTLLALVMAFADKAVVEEAYQWAIDHRFRLFSYGDLSVWDKREL